MINKNWKSHWKLVAMNKNNTAKHMVQYCLLKALTAKSNNKVDIALALLRQAFTPVSNTNELANGRKPFDTVDDIVYRLDWHDDTTIFGLDRTLLMNEDGLKAYRDLITAINDKRVSRSEPNYLFIFVRQDISKEQQAVQAAHATFKAGTTYRFSDADKTNFVLVGVPDMESLEEVKAKFKAKDFYGFVEFVEPDLGDTLTAIATAPLKEHKKSFLKEYKTLSFA